MAPGGLTLSFAQISSICFLITVQLTKTVDLYRVRVNSPQCGIFVIQPISGQTRWSMKWFHSSANVRFTTSRHPTWYETCAHRNQARREPQRGPGNILVGPPNIFMGPLWEKIFEFFFSEWYILAYFIFRPTAGPPNVAGPGVANPQPHPLDGPDRNVTTA